MIIQEMDLTMKHKSGRSNSNGDTLSRLPSAANVRSGDGDGVLQSRDAHGRPASAERNSMSCISHVCSVNVSSDVDSDNGLRDLQIDDSELGSILKYLENELPTDQKLAKRIVAESPQFDVLDGVLHFSCSDSSGNARIAVPECLKETVLKEAHGGCFAGHFAKRRTFELLKQRYWWKTMRSDVRKHCRLCLICASRDGPGRPLHPSLQPIPVGGLFNHVGVNVLQLPPTYNGNCYAIVFSDYLTKWPEAFPSPDQKAETIARLLVEQIEPRHGVPE